jgi:hypothetical protein
MLVIPLTPNSTANISPKIRQSPQILSRNEKVPRSGKDHLAPGTVDTGHSIQRQLLFFRIYTTKEKEKKRRGKTDEKAAAAGPYKV